MNPFADIIPIGTNLALDSIAQTESARNSLRRVLLFDDVRTTGATLRSASGALYRSGAGTVRVQALAGVQ